MILYRNEDILETRNAYNSKYNLNGRAIRSIRKITKSVATGGPILSQNTNVGTAAKSICPSDSLRMSESIAANADTTSSIYCVIYWICLRVARCREEIGDSRFIIESWRFQTSWSVEIRLWEILNQLYIVLQFLNV